MSIAITNGVLQVPGAQDKLRQKGREKVGFFDDYTMIDIETTGLSSYRDRITELGAVKVRNGQVVDTYSNLVINPKTNKVPAFITKLNGITEEKILAQGIPAEQAIHEFREFIGDDLIAGYNVNFDLNFTYDLAQKYHEAKLSNDYIDVLRLARTYYPGKHNRLLDVMKRSGIAEVEQHRGLDDSLDKILYLDVDLLVLKNIEELYSIDLKDKLIAAIEDYPIADRCKRLRIPADYGYFNSGVMLINLTLWRKYKITEQAYSILVRNDIILLQHDQDILNLIAYDKWLRLPFKWNVLDIFFFDYTPYDKKYYKEIAHSLKEDTGIMHFAGPLKPWIAWFPNPFYRHYYKYLSKTPWKGYTPSIKMQWRAYPFPRNLMTILKIDRVLVPLKKRITEYLKKSYVLKKERGI